MAHCVLPGDSIFDNTAYVNPGNDVPSPREQMRTDRDATARVTLLAVGGAIGKEVAAQVRHVPADATKLFLSIGGNDLLGEIDLRRVCWRDIDFVHSIEPSARGGRRIAAALEAYIGAIEPLAST